MADARIDKAVGIRNGLTTMPNLPKDLQTITELLDRIAIRDGGTREIGGLWAQDRNALIAEVTAAITAFQTINRRPKVDGVVDPGGGSLATMNRLAAPAPSGGISATVAPVPSTYKEEQGNVGLYVAEVTSVQGKGPLRVGVAGADYIRKLVRVEGSSINWFGVVAPRGGTWKVPHINFTPTPNQGHYYDPGYDSFSSWMQLWADYTSIIGGQMTAAGVPQILVIPFYKTGQSNNLGEFLFNWKDVVKAVLTAAVNSIDPLYLRNEFEFDQIVSSSFSNGYVAHKNFHTSAVGAADMTNILFDLDGVAGGSNWRPPKGLIYLNRAPGAMNPAGDNWFVGGRWSEFASKYGGNLNTHACCRNHLLYHGLWLRCR